MFGGSAPASVSTLVGENATNWHHYAFTWDASGIMRVYVDAVEVATVAKAYSDWSQEQPYLVVGVAAYKDRWLPPSLPSARVHASYVRRLCVDHPILHAPAQADHRQPHRRASPPAAWCGRWLLDLPHNTNTGFGIDGELDDLGYYARALTPAEIAAIATTSQADTDGAGADSDLVLFWDFNDGPNGGVVPNKGTAGTDYDLLLGQLPK